MAISTDSTRTNKSEAIAKVWNDTVHDCMHNTNTTEEMCEEELFPSLHQLPSFIMSLCVAANALGSLPEEERHFFEIRAVCLYATEQYLPMLHRQLLLEDSESRNEDASTERTLVKEGDAIRFERGTNEKIMPREFPEVTLEHIDILLFMCASLLDTFQLPIRCKCAMRNTLLMAVSASDQLSSDSLCALLKCFAQCVDSWNLYSELFSQQKEETAAERIDLGVLGVREGIRSFLPICDAAANAADVPPSHTSPIELEERNQMERWRGGAGSSRVMATHNLALLHQVSGVLQRRINAVLSEYHIEHFKSPQTADNVWRDNAARVVASLKEEASREGKRGLMSLEARKKTEAPAAPKKQRKTIGTLSNAKPAASTTAAPESQKAEKTITLLDVAECCTSLAAMRFGDGAYWDSVVRFTSWSLFCFRNEANSATFDQEAEEDVFLKEVRDILFAFDYVQRHDLYDFIMKELVQYGFLSAPIPPPSQALGAIKQQKKEERQQRSRRDGE
ncbi:hypothetical protein ADEAN_000325800 [Angomonas deanei]|uniref:Uncharacterized protein n=1 Tax=Angomonas deanei TaxID=59799 RepID=A0A7G2C7J9_9TRYP|nr:hypothetical protein ADEAN_000325800 [Angomonas deanei]